MRKFLALALASSLLVSGAAALSTAQQTTHINQVLSNLGAVVITCPTSFPDYVCATTTSSVSLTTKGWDLYSDWDSKVTTKAKHVTPWALSSNGSVTTAQFAAPDGDRYIVGVGEAGGKTMIAVKWMNSTSSQTAPAAAPQASGVTGAPSSVVNASAAPTRTGPLVVTMGSRDSYDLYGPVKRLVRRTMTVAANGSETLATSETITFHQNGGLLSLERSEPGKALYTATNTYDASGRIVSRDLKDEKGKVTQFRSEYDAQGNLVVRTKFEDGQKTTVTRYTAFPNGYLAEDFGATGAATTRTFVVMDAQNREVDQEILGKVGLRVQRFYEGDYRTKTVFDLGGLGTTTSEYQNGLETKYSSIGAGLLKGKDTIKIYRYEGVDSRGNYGKKIEGTETVSFGEKKFVPEKVTYQTVEYY